MSNEKFIMPVLIKAGDLRMEKGFGKRIAAFDCYIVEAENLRNLIAERDTYAEDARILEQKIVAAEKERDELLATIEHIREYWNGDYNDTAVANALDHIMETCDEAIEKAKAGAA